MSDLYGDHALDRRLEEVIKSHETATPSPTPSVKESAESGLRSYAERSTIAEEISNISKAAGIDLREELAREQMLGFAAARSQRMDDFHDAIKEAAAAENDPVKTAEALIRSGIDPQEAARRALT